MSLFLSRENHNGHYEIKNNQIDQPIFNNGQKVFDHQLPLSRIEHSTLSGTFTILNNKNLKKNHHLGNLLIIMYSYLKISLY